MTADDDGTAATDGDATRAKVKGAPLVSSIVDYLDDRLGSASFVRTSLRKPFPDHWSFMLGEIALYALVVIILSGVFLTMFFEASTEKVVYDGPVQALRGSEVSLAYNSALQLSFEVRAGLLMRQIHHWAALVFIFAICAHLLRIFFTGAFRRPREINWFVGSGLLVLAMAEGFTGYSLPDDLLSGTGARIAYSVVLAIPLIGEWLAFLLFGGQYPTKDMIPRFLVFHVMLLPALVLGSLAMHLMIMWRQKHTDHALEGRTEDNAVGHPVWPHFAMTSVGFFFLIAGAIVLLAGLVQINPIWTYGPYDPTQVSQPAQPDWYIGWLEGSLRLAPNWEWHVFGHTIPAPFVPGVVIPGIFFTALFAWPWIERRISGDREVHNLLDRPRDLPWRTAVGMAALTFMTVLTIAGGNDLIAAVLMLPIEPFTWVLRTAVWVLPPLVGWITYRVCLDLRARELSPVGRPRRAVFRRTASGGIGE